MDYVLAMRRPPEDDGTLWFAIRTLAGGGVVALAAGAAIAAICFVVGFLLRGAYEALAWVWVAARGLVS